MRVMRGTRTGRVKAGRDPGGVRGCQRRTPTVARGATLGISEREGSGESKGGSGLAYSGDLGAPPWNGEPGASERLAVGEYCVAFHSGPRRGRRAAGRWETGDQRRSPPGSATLGWGCPEAKVTSGRFGSLETLQPGSGRLRSQGEAGVTPRVATVAAGSLRSVGGQFLSWGGCSEGDSARGRRLTGGSPEARCCSWGPAAGVPLARETPGTHSAHLFSGHVPFLLAPFSLMGLPKRFCSLTDRTSNGEKKLHRRCAPSRSRANEVQGRAAPATRPRWSHLGKFSASLY